MIDKFILYPKLAGALFSLLWERASRGILETLHRYTYKKVESPRNVVVIGASFAGFYAAKLLANSLPTGYRVVVIEKNSHFQFTWVFPRFSVVSGHDHKAFIPFGPFLRSAPEGSYLFLQDTVTEVGRKTVHLQSGQDIEYDYLILATGSQAGPPSRLGATEKEDGIHVLQNMQERIRHANNIIFVGGGAAGVEIAADAKEHYPSKTVTLIHSRTMLLNTFGNQLHKVSLEALEKLGVRVVLGERLGSDAEESGSVRLNSGEQIPCDLLIKCVGQKPTSHIIAALSPSSISKESGCVMVKPTMQLLDPSLENIYAAGDVVEFNGVKNSRSAMEQVVVASDNIVRSIAGKRQKEYHRKWWEGAIELTLGLENKVLYLQDGDRQVVMPGKMKDIALKSAQLWKMLGVEPYTDEASKIETSSLAPKVAIIGSGGESC